MFYTHSKKNLVWFILIILAASTLYFVACKKGLTEQELSPNGVVVQERNGDCPNYPELVGLSYQTVRYNSSEQIVEMYNFLSENDISAFADPLIEMHQTQGQQATLNYMRTQLGYSEAEIALLNDFLNRASQIDYEHLTIDVVEEFVNDYRDYLCTTYNGTNNPASPANPPIDASPGEEVSPESAQLLKLGNTIVRISEGSLKALLDMSKGEGADDRSGWDCPLCGLISAVSISYYAAGGYKLGELTAPVTGKVGAIVGAIVGGLIGANKALKTDECKSCFNSSNGPTCTDPTKITFTPISCDEVMCRLVGQINLPSANFNWDISNSIPELISTEVPTLRILVPNKDVPTVATVLFDNCSGNEQDQINSFRLKEDFLNHGDFGMMLNSSVLAPGQNTEIIVSPAKVWNSSLYSISYSTTRGFITDHPDFPNSPLVKRLVNPSSFPGGGGNGSSSTGTVTVTLTNLCLGTTVTKTQTVTFN